jgi:uncharacterized protein (DUF934 family)
MPKIIRLCGDTPEIQEDVWQFIGKEQAEQINVDEINGIWPLEHWQAHYEQGRALSGVWLGPEHEIDVVALAKPAPKLVALHFEALTDGRGFSQARMLRQRYGYEGELRAVGSFMADQMQYMVRCGFDSFVPDAGIPDHMESFFKVFSLAYQAATDDIPVVLKRRI